MLIPNKLGWFIMEIFVLIVLYLFLILCKTELNWVSYFMIFLFTIHYFNRAVIFPFRIKTKGKKMPISIVFMAMFFNLMNGFLIGFFFANYAKYDVSWFYSPQFIIGTIIFLCGMIINMYSDQILIGLRKGEETGYKIPKGFLFKYISCPNLFGEVIEWLGFAILMWNLPGLAFFVWTFANLVPRALSHHRWYHENFSEYPTERKAVFPKIW